MALDDSQQITLEVGMGARADGTWAANTMGDAESRQNGKGDTIQARELYGLVVLNERIAHTAHEAPTALQAFQRMEALFRAHKSLHQLVKKYRYANGEQAIELHSGAFIIYRTRTGSGLRGFDEIDLLVVDEAQHAQEEHMAASTPAQAVSANPQTWFAGSAGMSHSVVWWRLRLAALSPADGPLGWVEHTAERLWFDEKGRLRSESPDPYDEAAWAMANPAYGYRIAGGGAGSRRYFESQLFKLGPQLFAREHLGVWDPLPSTDEDAAKLPADNWAATLTDSPPVVEPGACVLGFDVHANTGAIAIATGTLSGCYVEVTDHRSGDGWLPARLVELAQRWKPLAIGMESGNGPAAAILGPIREVFEDAGLNPDIIKPLTGRDYRDACGGFYEAVMNGTLRRPIVSPDNLELAGSKCPERVIGDAFVWDRRAASVPISSLVAATVARSLLSDKPPRPFFFA